ncbi:hypothetical protein Shyd_84780 [Streptomyces hydrogenans]|uniref:Uncharacterized protein n=2 Tax=Streptomyces hydrogenans TaxID=1873719 RepID=A0ABQ3PQ26_9ACTN|nr:hypothetical protein GCM10018784_70610 [Streptomyces hydrogenans]GHI22733.1 hypothetical protein Shyd_41040 [Streptomyces hydrogenans]GHI24532.1 hypothetical protein Shyd_59030 [Streptomyces hydrogenans]GHI25910.1 hypothetical protein Shyd_72810 [Streptomyces hydrogenans]GHI26873.1 hypothetical protein Shyd_82440 [Streptomyces hydrogenans]
MLVHAEAGILAGGRKPGGRTAGRSGSVPAAARGVGDGMGLVDRAGPGIEEQADRVAEAACELADAAAGSGWSAAADDVLVAIDTLSAALAQIGPDVGEALAAVTAATTKARLRLGLPADTGQEPDRAATPPGVPGPRTGRRPRRRGLGPGAQGVFDRRSR